MYEKSLIPGLENEFVRQALHRQFTLVNRIMVVKAYETSLSRMEEAAPCASVLNSSCPKKPAKLPAVPALPGNCFVLIIAENDSSSRKPQLDEVTSNSYK